MKKLAIYLGGLFMMIAFVLPSCSKDVVDDELTTDVLKCTTDTTHAVCGDGKTVDLFGGQHILVGHVDISNDGTNLYVTYHATGGWSLTELHLYVGDISLMPYNKAMNPTIGHFPFKVEGLPFPTYSYTFTIPMATLPRCFEVVAHAVVKNGGQTETAYMLENLFTTAFGTGHWGGYASYCKEDCEQICVNKKAWVTGVQRTSTPFQGYYNVFTPGGEPVVANIVDFSSRHAGATVGTITYTDDGLNLVVNVAMYPGFYLSQYLAYFGSTAGFTPYITSMGGVNISALPISAVMAPDVALYTYTIPLSSLTKNSNGSLMLLQFVYFCDPI